MQIEDNPFKVIEIVKLLALRSVEKHSLVNADQVICVYKSICSYTSRWIDECEVIYNSIPSIPEVKTNHSSFRRAVLVGRLIPGKNPANVIRALVYLPELRLDIIGDGPLRDELIGLAKDLRVIDCEGNVLMPLVERWAVGLPPVLGIAATVMFGLLFGLLGVLLAAPAMIVLMVVVERLYIKGVLEEGG
jgi:glycosyltransferase involved in cell wall biosynthesis